MASDGQQVLPVDVSCFSHSVFVYLFKKIQVSQYKNPSASHIWQPWATLCMKQYPRAGETEGQGLPLCVGNCSTVLSALLIYVNHPDAD